MLGWARPWGCLGLSGQDVPWIELMGPQTLHPLAQFSRATNATRINEQGSLEVVAAGTPRRDFLLGTSTFVGWLLEEQRTNQIINPRGEDAVVGTPGSLPSGWSESLSAGIGRQVVGVGVESGVPFVDIRYFGTPASTSFINIVPRLDTPGAQGQTWTGSFYSRLVAGNFANVTSRRIELRETTNTNAFLTNSVLDTTVDGVLRRWDVTRALSHASTQWVSVRHIFGHTAGAAINFTIRVGAPQLEQGAFATSVILPPVGTPQASTRGADMLVFSLPDIGMPDGFGSVFGNFRLGQSTSPIIRAVVQLDNGSESNRVALRILPLTTTLGIVRVTEGAAASAPGGTFSVGSPVGFSLRRRSDGTADYSLSAGALSSVIGAPGAGVLTSLRVARNSIGNSLNGWISHLAVTPADLSDTQLRAIAA